LDYDDLDVDQIINEVYAAEAEGRTRRATTQEIMKVRLAALAAIVRNLQEIVDSSSMSCKSQGEALIADSKPFLERDAESVDKDHELINT
jgi:hypothetical protein